jgi:hypothetical protein
MHRRAGNSADPRFDDIRLIDVYTVAHILGVSASTVWRLRDQGHLPPLIRVGATVRTSPLRPREIRVILKRMEVFQGLPEAEACLLESPWDIRAALEAVTQVGTMRAAEGRREPSPDVVRKLSPGADSTVDGATIVGQITCRKRWHEESLARKPWRPSLLI